MRLKEGERERDRQTYREKNSLRANGNAVNRQDAAIQYATFEGLGRSQVSPKSKGSMWSGY